VFAVFIERAARMQVLAQSIGKIQADRPGPCARGARISPQAARGGGDVPLLCKSDAKEGREELD